MQKLLVVAILAAEQPSLGSLFRGIHSKKMTDMPEEQRMVMNYCRMLL